MGELAEIPGFPAALLSPAWGWPGPVPSSPPELGDACDIGRWRGFTICARVCKAAAEESTGCRILQKGEPPSGWAFSAPSSIGGVVAFAAGARASEPEKAEEEPPPEPAEPTPEGEAEAPPPRGEDDVGSTRIDDGQSHHVAVSYSGGRLCVYVDGQLDGEASLEVPAAAGAALLLGPETADEGAQVLDVKVFSEALSDNQIADLANECKDLPTGISLPLLPAAVVEFKKLKAQSDIEAARTMLLKALGLGKDPDRSFQDEVICDFFLGLLEYSESINLTARKTAVIVGIMQRIFDCMRLRSKTTPNVGEPYSSSECFLEYKRLLLAHAATSAAALAAAAGTAVSTPERLQIFTVPEVKQLTEYVAGVLFEHFLLYQCTLICPQDSETINIEVTMERPRFCPDLQRAKLLPAPQERSSSVLSNVPRGMSAVAPTGRTAESTLLPTSAGAAKETTAGAASASTQAAPHAKSGTLAPGQDPLDHHIAQASQAAEQEIEAAIQRRDEALGLSKAK